MLSGLLYLGCQMLDRTCNSVGHRRETEVGGGIMAIRGEMGNYQPTWMTCDKVSFTKSCKVAYEWYGMRICTFHTVNLPTEYE